MVVHVVTVGLLLRDGAGGVCQYMTVSTFDRGDGDQCRVTCPFVSGGLAVLPRDLIYSAAAACVAEL
jgi:hypothetical protein